MSSSDEYRGIKRKSEQDERSDKKKRRKEGGGGARPKNCPLSERQQVALLMQMTAEESSANKATTSNKAAKSAVVTTPRPAAPRKTPSNSGKKDKINKRNERGETPLHLATIKGELPAIQDLVRQGADINVQDYAGWTPLHEACNHGYHNVAKFLLDSGANVNSKGLDNDYPLHDAVINAHVDIVELLLKHGANPLLPNKSGERPLDLGENELIRRMMQSEILMSSDESDDTSFIQQLKSPSIRGDQTTEARHLGAGKVNRKLVRQLYSATTSEADDEKSPGEKGGGAPQPAQPISISSDDSSDDDRPLIFRHKVASSSTSSEQLPAASAAVSKRRPVNLSPRKKRSPKKSPAGGAKHRPLFPSFESSDEFSSTDVSNDATSLRPALSKQPAELMTSSATTSHANSEEELTTATTTTSSSSSSLPPSMTSSSSSQRDESKTTTSSSSDVYDFSPTSDLFVSESVKLKQRENKQRLKQEAKGSDSYQAKLCTERASKSLDSKSSKLLHKGGKSLQRMKSSDDAATKSKDASSRSKHHDVAGGDVRKEQHHHHHPGMATSEMLFDQLFKTELASVVDDDGAKTLNKTGAKSKSDKVDASRHVVDPPLPSTPDKSTPKESKSHEHASTYRDASSPDSASHDSSPYDHHHHHHVTRDKSRDETHDQHLKARDRTKAEPKAVQRPLFASDKVTVQTRPPAAAAGEASTPGGGGKEHSTPKKSRARSHDTDTDHNSSPAAAVVVASKSLFSGGEERSSPFRSLSLDAKMGEHEAGDAKSKSKSAPSGGASAGGGGGGKERVTKTNSNPSSSSAPKKPCKAASTPKASDATKKSKTPGKREERKESTPGRKEEKKVLECTPAFICDIENASRQRLHEKKLKRKKLLIKKTKEEVKPSPVKQVKLSESDAWLGSLAQAEKQKHFKLLQQRTLVAKKSTDQTPHLAKTPSQPVPASKPPTESPTNHPPIIAKSQSEPNLEPPACESAPTTVKPAAATKSAEPEQPANAAPQTVEPTAPCPAIVPPPPVQTSPVKIATNPQLDPIPAPAVAEPDLATALPDQMAQKLITAVEMPHPIQVVKDIDVSLTAAPPAEVECEIPVQEVAPQQPEETKPGDATAEEAKEEEKPQEASEKEKMLQEYIKSKLESTHIYFEEPRERLPFYFPLSKLLAESDTPSHRPTSYDERLFITKFTNEKRKRLTSVVPQAPQYYWEYMCFTGGYHLSGKKESVLSVPVLAAPPALHAQMRALFNAHEQKRVRMRIRHAIEREKLILTCEQAIMRVHARAARTIHNQQSPYSVCTFLMDQDIYNVPSSNGEAPSQQGQQQAKPSIRDRFNARMLHSWRQDVDDKFVKMKSELLSRQRHEAEAMFALQRTEWIMKCQDLDDGKRRLVGNEMNEVHVPIVNINSDFDLLPG